MNRTVLPKFAADQSPYRHQPRSGGRLSRDVLSCTRNISKKWFALCDCVSLQGSQDTAAGQDRPAGDPTDRLPEVAFLECQFQATRHKHIDGHRRLASGGLHAKNCPQSLPTKNLSCHCPARVSRTSTTNHSLSHWTVLKTVEYCGQDNALRR